MSSSNNEDSNILEKKPARKYRKQVRIKSTAKYKVPQSVFEKARQQVYGDYNKCDYHFKCHQNSYLMLNTNEPPSCKCNFLEAANQAMEDKNYKVLYEIISKSLKIRDNLMMQQMHEYMFIAIQQDPVIDDKREQLINDFLTRVKLFNEGGVKAQKFLHEANTFGAFKSEDNCDDVDFDNLSEASSVDITDMLKTLKEQYGSMSS